VGRRRRGDFPASPAGPYWRCRRRRGGGASMTILDDADTVVGRVDIDYFRQYDDGD
jgi:hypothetical protein